MSPTRAAPARSRPGAPDLRTPDPDTPAASRAQHHKRRHAAGSLEPSCLRCIPHTLPYPTALLRTARSMRPALRASDGSAPAFTCDTNVPAVQSTRSAAGDDWSTPTAESDTSILDPARSCIAGGMIPAVG
ncbi:hypothetical protein B0H17DRAFT_1340835 [Mycena rosella]|uniref:Uncharacterized protein n=1 Tax=Mycena rosella TaxID=1033263 RepID=A0AAD7BF91_MYCRO|nr:hypothetical protein B0H17DRAFT_1340835 [Mycena rosella]